MKLLTVLFAVLILASCNKEGKEAQYIVEVTGDDYADDLYIVYINNIDEADGLAGKPLELSGGKATISGYKKGRFTFNFMSYESPTATPHTPVHQDTGDKIHISAYKSKRGKKGDKVGELDLVCSSFSDDGNRGRIEVHW